MAHGVRTILLAALGAALGACETQPTHEVIAVTDILPRQMEVGDRVVLRGSGFPLPGDIRRLTVTLSGNLARPGMPACARPVTVTLADPAETGAVTDPITGVERESLYATTSLHTLRVLSGTEIEFVMTEALLRALTTCPGERAVEAPHATLSLTGPRAGVSVRVETMQGTTLASARALRGPRVDLLTPWGHGVERARAARAEAERALAVTGIQLAAVQPTEGGFHVERVAPASPADEAGLSDGDVLERLDGVSLLAVTDFRPAAGNETSVVSVRRGDAVEDRPLRVTAVTRGAPGDAVAAAVLLLVALAAVVFGMDPRGGLWAWLSTRLTWRARPSWRALREALSRDGEAAALASAALATTALAVPFAESLAGLDVDLTVAHGALALATAAWWVVAWRARAATPTLRGALGSLGGALALEVPALAAVALAVLAAGDLGALGIAGSQDGAPWGWNLLRNPMFLAAGTAHLGAVAALAARGEVDALRPLRVARWALVAARAALAATLLLGGMRLPAVPLAAQEASVALQMLGAAALCAKSWGIVFVARALAPRLASARPALRRALALRYALPLAVIALVTVVAGELCVREAPAPVVEVGARVLSLVTAGLALLALASLARRADVAR